MQNAVKYSDDHVWVSTDSKKEQEMENTNNKMRYPSLSDVMFFKKFFTSLLSAMVLE